MPAAFRQSGVTLIELMVSMTIGLLISLIIGTVFVNGSRAYAQDDRYARMLENGRYALEQIVTDLRLIAFWGEMTDPAAIATALLPGEDCDIDVFDGSTPVLFNNPHAAPPTVQFDIDANSCPDTMVDVRAGTSQLALKHTSGLGLTAGAADSVVFLRSNGTAGTLVDDAGSTALPAGFQDWEYSPAIYYIGDIDGIPRLCRSQLSETAFPTASPDDQCVATGVEQFHVQFGLDTDTDGVVNRYKSNPTAAEMEQAIIARVYVLVRSETADPAYKNNKTYNLGDLVVDAGGDGFYRRVFSSTVKLRNPANLASLR